MRRPGNAGHPEAPDALARGGRGRSVLLPMSGHLRAGTAIEGAAVPGARLAGAEVGEQRACEIARALALAEALDRDLIDRLAPFVRAVQLMPKGVR